MGYKYKDICYETKQEFINSFAQSCNGSSGSGGLSSYYTICTANSDNITVQAFSLTNGTPQTAFTFTPQLINCTYTEPYTNTDVSSLAWMVVAVWVAAWGFKKAIEVIRK